METAVKKLYEGMFLIDSALAASDWDGVIKTIEKVLKRAKAEVISIRKWDERELAYDIKHKSRGTYILSYFRADGSNISGIERDVQLNEQLIRVLILNAEDMSEDDVAKDTPATITEKRHEPRQGEAESAQEAEEAQVAEGTKETEQVEQTESLSAGDIVEEVAGSEQGDAADTENQTTENSQDDFDVEEKKSV